MVVMTAWLCRAAVHGLHDGRDSAFRKLTPRAVRLSLLGDRGAPAVRALCLLRTIKVSESAVYGDAVAS